LFEPIRIGNVQVRNRFVMAPMGPAGMSDGSGAFNQRGIDYYAERARGGVGLIITGTSIIENEIEPRNLPFMPCPTINSGAFIASAKLLTERIHAYDARIFIQLTVGFGRVIFPAVIQRGGRLVGPSENSSVWDSNTITRALSTEEVKTLIDKMGEAAAICKYSGFDGVEIHAVHEGYLLDQFAVSLFNRRSDQYGGAITNRLRFAVEIVQTIKDTCGEDYPVAIRYSLKHFIKGLNKGGLPGESFLELGRDIEEGLEVAKMLEVAGYQAIDVDAGSYDSWYWSHPPAYFEKGMYLEFGRKLKEILSVPIITAGRLDDPVLASASVREGKTDMIGLARPLLADPHLVKKIQQDKIDLIRPCLSCHDGCLNRMNVLLSCAVNPATGRESEFAIKRSYTVKRLMIIGGGVAGCEAARVCAFRGHRVSLYEKNARLGGNLIPGSIPDFKKDERRLLEWYERQLTDLGVEVRLNTVVRKRFIEENEPDVVIIATGSRPKTLDIKFSSNEKIASATDVLLGYRSSGDKTVIMGGGLVGCETALWLAKQGKEVTIVEALADVLLGGDKVCPPNEQMLRDLLHFHKVQIKTEASLLAVDDTGVTIRIKEDVETIAADSLIVAVGYEPDRNLWEEIRKSSFDSYLLGDARVVRNIMNAIWDANEVCRGI